jgi:hypothetical protein
MYHIWAAQCQIQLDAGKRIDDGDFAWFAPSIALQSSGKLAFAIVGRVAGMNQRQNIVAAERRLDLGKAADDCASFAGDCQGVECRAFEQPFSLRR